jgi:hypothetical protein
MVRFSSPLKPRFLWSALLLLLAIYVVAIYITQVGLKMALV